MANNKSDFLGGKKPGSLPPALIWITAFAAFVLCWAGSPWQASFAAGLTVTLLSAAPLTALVVLTSRSHRHGRRLWDQSAEEAAFVAAGLPGAAEEYRAKLRSSRRAAADAARGGGSQLPAIDGDGLCAETLRWVQHRYAGGEDLRCDSLRDFLGQVALAKVDPLQRYHEYAFCLGLLGTVAGLGAQVWVVQRMEQGDFFAGSFLTGVVLKAGVTVVGILVALYARDLRWQQLERYDRLAARLEAFVVAQVAPLFQEVRSERGEITEALRQAVDGFSTTVKTMGEELEHKLLTAVDTAGDRMKIFATETLSSSMKRQIADPFCEAVRGLNNAIGQTRDAVAESSGAFKTSMDGLKEEVAGALRSQSAADQLIKDNVAALRGLMKSLEEVTGEIQKAGDLMRQYRGELELAIDSVRTQDSAGGSNGHITAEQVRLAELLNASLSRHNEALSEVAHILHSLSVAKPEGEL